MGILDTLLDTFRSPDPKVVKQRIAAQIQEHQNTKAEIEKEMRKLQDAIRKLSERIRRMERENPSSIGNIRQEKATKTNLEYQELELKSVIRKLDEEIARLTAQYHKLAA